MPGLDRRKALKEAKRLGCLIRRSKGSELLVTHSLVDGIVSVGMGNQRKCCSRVLTVFLKRVRERAEGSS